MHFKLNSDVVKPELESTLNADLQKLKLQVINQNHPSLNDFLFKSGKGDKPLSNTSVSRLVRRWLVRTGLSEKYKGIRGLRSTIEEKVIDSQEPFPEEKKLSSNYVLPMF